MGHSSVRDDHHADLSFVVFISVLYNFKEERGRRRKKGGGVGRDTSS